MNILKGRKIYIYTYIYVCVYIYIYIYINILRQVFLLLILVDEKRNRASVTQNNFLISTSEFKLHSIRITDFGKRIIYFKVDYI